MSCSKENIINLLRCAPGTPGVGLPPGAAADEIAPLSRLLSTTVPEELVEWLGISNGPCIGPGGLFGVYPAQRWLRIEEHLKQHSTWQTNNWIPVAGDGLGNFFVLDISKRFTDFRPIYFIDHEKSYDEPAYVVASSLWHFLYFLLQREVDESEGRTGRWPFDANYVLKADPDLEVLKEKLPLPWAS